VRRWLHGSRNESCFGCPQALICDPGEDKFVTRKDVLKKVFRRGLVFSRCFTSVVAASSLPAAGACIEDLIAVVAQVRCFMYGAELKVCTQKVQFCKTK